MSFQSCPSCRRDFRAEQDARQYVVTLPSPASSHHAGRLPVASNRRIANPQQAHAASRSPPANRPRSKYSSKDLENAPPRNVTDVGSSRGDVPICVEYGHAGKVDAGIFVRSGVVAGPCCIDERDQRSSRARDANHHPRVRSSCEQPRSPSLLGVVVCIA
jgi:hypothetical protein